MGPLEERSNRLTQPAVVLMKLRYAVSDVLGKCA